MQKVYRLKNLIVGTKLKKSPRHISCFRLLDGGIVKQVAETEQELCLKRPNQIGKVLVSGAQTLEPLQRQPATSVRSIRLTFS